MKINEFLKKVLELNSVEEPNGHFDTIIKRLTPPAGYWEEMTFTIPSDYKVFKDTCFNSPNKFILVELENGDAHIFYPSVLYRTVPIFTSNREWTGKFARVSGTVVDFVQQFTLLDDAVKALVGKKITVSKVTAVFGYNGWKIIPTFDFV